MNAFGLQARAHVFVPLCGKSRDLIWLAQQGYQVIGTELSKLAVEQFFRELGGQLLLTEIGALKRYELKGIVIFPGNIFDLTTRSLGPIDLVYDRAALVALPVDLRERYAKHLLNLTAIAPQLLICYEYDQECADGPPFYLEEGEIRHVYGEAFDLNLLARTESRGHEKQMSRLRNRVAASAPLSCFLLSVGVR